MIQETHKKIILLLGIAIIGCLGALPIAPHFLVPIKIASTKPAAPAYTDGQCPSSMLTDILTKMQTASPPVTTPASLAAVWTQEDYTKQDYTNAQACALAFVNTYESFDYHQMQSLYTAMPLLSADAKNRFYQGYDHTSANVRTNQDWEKQIQKSQTIQKAQVGTAKLETYTNKNKELFLTFDIPCQLSITQVQGKPTTKNISMTVLLKKVQPDKNIHGVGWQISDWRETEVATKPKATK